MIIVDANIIAYLLLETEHTPLAEAVWARDPDWYVPVLWRSEVENILVNAVRHNHLTIEKARERMEMALHILDDREDLVSSDQVLILATQSGCTAYDCEYVALARQYGVSLVTFDKAIVKKFPETALFPADFLKN
jgi:predicted nucleic acid-binding protein